LLIVGDFLRPPAAGPYLTKGKVRVAPSPEEPSKSEVTHSFCYSGTELELFETANNWKTYLAQILRPYIGETVIEVGAGIGGSTRYLCTAHQKRWICVEPDPNMAITLHDSLVSGRLPANCEVFNGTLAEVSSSYSVNTVLYVDVLEHIENDQYELNLASQHLLRDGYLVVLSPAIPFLYSAFDRAVGHHRRYRARDVDRLTPDLMSVERIMFIDSIGLFASLANRLLLRSAMPTPLQVRFWDTVMVPASRLFDRLTGHLIGKSIVMVWKR
jgi:predicted O-methyltransferase YrrM